jgi:hypothetical protein
MLAREEKVLFKLDLDKGGFQEVKEEAIRKLASAIWKETPHEAANLLARRSSCLAESN